MISSAYFTLVRRQKDLDWGSGHFNQHALFTLLALVLFLPLLHHHHLHHQGVRLCSPLGQQM